MKQELSYKEAYTRLEALVYQLEDDTIQLEQLAETVKNANELIAVCEEKLRSVGNEVKEIIKQ